MLQDISKTNSCEAEHARRFQNLFFWCMVLIAAAGLSACEKKERAPKKPPNLVIITIDTLRADHMGCYGYFRDTSPKIDTFSEKSIFFERCLAPVSTTLPSHTSLFTGTYPHEHGILANIKHGGLRFIPSPKLQLLSEIAARAGYLTAGFVSATPVKLETGMGSGFKKFDQPNGRERSAEMTNRQLLTWLAKQKREPFYLWVHYFDPHAPYKPLAPFDSMFKTDEKLQKYLRERRFSNRATNINKKTAEALDAHNAYDGEVRYVDTHVGALLKRLEATGAWDNTVLVLVGDHGEGLYQHGELGHGSVWDEQVHVPLMIRVPGRSPMRVSETMSLVDIIPTLLGLAPELPFNDFLAQASGRDVLSNKFEPRLVFSQSSGRDRPSFEGHQYALTGMDWKYVYNPSGSDRLFCIKEDPFELIDVVSENEQISKKLKEVLLEEIARQAAKGVQLQTAETEEDVPMDPKLLEELRALGYID